MSFWDHFGVMLASYRGRFGIILATFWGQIGVLMASSWGQLGVNRRDMEPNLCGHTSKAAPWTPTEPSEASTWQAETVEKLGKTIGKHRFFHISRNYVYHGKPTWKNRREGLGRRLGKPWGRLGGPWGRLGRPWGRLGKPWRRLGKPWGRLGRPFLESLPWKTLLEGPTRPPQRGQHEAS